MTSSLVLKEVEIYYGAVQVDTLMVRHYRTRKTKGRLYSLKKKKMILESKVPL